MQNQAKSEQIILIPETKERNNTKFNHEVIQKLRVNSAAVH